MQNEVKIPPFHSLIEDDTTQIILGNVVARPATMDQSLAKDLLEMGKYHDFTTVTGKTMCCDDFYEGQGRLDGAICVKKPKITD